MGKIVAGVILVVASIYTFGAASAFIGFLSRAALSVGLSLISSKLFGSKVPKSARGLAGVQTTVRDTLQYRKVVYGQALVSGPVAYHNLSGSDGEYAWYVIALCQGQSESIEAVWLDGAEILASEIDWTAGTGGSDGTGTGNVSNATWLGTDSPQTVAVQLFWALGHADQVAMSKLTDAFTDWDTDNRGRGVTYGVGKFLYNTETESIWEEQGQPRDIKFLVKGRKLYDPRLDSTRIIDATTSPVTYGSGSHRLADDTTWAWSDNPILCWADYRTQIMNAAETAINWPSVASGADDCETLAAIPPAASPENTEKRFSCNGALNLGDPHKDNLEAILSSCAGRDSWKQGMWSVRASVYESPGLTIDGDDLTSEPIVVQGNASRSERFNTVRGFYIDPNRKYEAVEFAQVTSAAYVARDGETLSKDLELPMTNSEYMAQRIAYRMLEAGNNMVIAETTLQAVGARLGASDVISVDWWPLGWTDGGNLLLYSEDLSQTWSNTRSTDTQSAGLGPFATADANSLNEDGTASNTHYIAQTFTAADNTVYTLSVYLKASNRTWARLDVLQRDGTVLSVYFDLANGIIGTAGATAHMESVGNGWHRCGITADLGSGGTSEACRIFVAEDDGDVTFSGLTQESILVWGAQLEAWFEPRYYVPTTSATATTVPKVMRVEEWSKNEDGTHKVTLREDDEGDYTDPLVAEYTTISNGTITVPGIVIAPPTALTAATALGGVSLDWTDPPSRLYKYIEVWASDDNVRGNAELIATVPKSPYLDTVFDAFFTRYYWVRAVNFQGNSSNYEPNSSTTTASAYPGIQNQTLVPDPLVRFGLSYWDVVTGSVTFASSGGTLGTGVLALTPSFSLGCSFVSAARRGPREYDTIVSGPIVIIVTWRVQLFDAGSAGTWSQYVRPGVLVSDLDESNGVSYLPNISEYGQIWTDSDTEGVWREESAQIIVEDSGTAPRFIQIGMSTGNNAFGPTFYVDSIEATIV